MLLLYTNANYGANSLNSLTQTQTKLQELNQAINSLKQTLSTAHDKRGLLYQELAENEKKIGEDVKKLRKLQGGIDLNHQKITHLQQRVNELNEQLTMQQKLLAEHIRLRYKMGEYQPIKWIINQDDPYSIGRLLTYHQYLVRTRQHIIDDIDLTKNNLVINQNSLKDEIKRQNRFQQDIHAHQQQLEQRKYYHNAVIQSLNKDIQSKQLRLNEFEANKRNLSQLLKTIGSQTSSYSKQPFKTMQHKLVSPLQGVRAQRIKQGIVFLAPEGTYVKAVYSGKIVFSDWLNGYGLLLIIDHGEGFMTLYAHNQSLFKRKGTNVITGESIAAVGHSGGSKQNGLYFEVRQRGKVISPLDWLKASG